METVTRVTKLFVLYRLKRAEGQHGVTTKKICQEGLLCPKETLYLSLLEKSGKEKINQTPAYLKKLI